MPNTLTGLATDIYKAADVVSREQTGYVAGCLINDRGSNQAALGDSITASFTRQPTVGDNTPSMTIPEGNNQQVDPKSLTISKSRGVPIPWEGEESLSMRNSGLYDTIYGDQLAQAMRAIVNEIETDLAIEAYRNASRAVGTPGTTPFATNHNAVNATREVLLNNGCPLMDQRLSLVLSSSASTNFRNLGNLYKVNEAGTDALLRQGILQDISGFAIRESVFSQAHSNGAATGYLTAAAASIGDTEITVDTGSGAFNPGDVITFTGDSVNSYVVTAYTAGTITIGTPGLRADVADNVAISTANEYSANVAFHQTALELAVRAPAMPAGGDAAVDRVVVTDPRSGISFDVSLYAGFQKAMINVSAVWGVKAWKPDHIAILRG